MESALLLIALLIAIWLGWGMFGNILSFVLALFLWMFIGNVAGYIIRGEEYGVAGNIALGLIGGIVGSFLLRFIGLGGLLDFWLIGPLIGGVVGAIIVVHIARWTIDRNFGK
jgi:uncharacterized membrane protein YeaQ/YmgE (transglycosylase-associated protein family)